MILHHALWVENSTIVGIEPEDVPFSRAETIDAQLIYKAKGASRIALVANLMRAVGMPEGTSVLGSLKAGQQVIVEDGVAKMPDRTAFSGSVATADSLVGNMIYSKN